MDYGLPLMVDLEEPGGVFNADKWATMSAGGGTGNPGANGGWAYSKGWRVVSVGQNWDMRGNNGTGGLLVIYCDKYDNKGNIEANGVETRAVGQASGGASRRWCYKNFLQ